MVRKKTRKLNKKWLYLFILFMIMFSTITFYFHRKVEILYFRNEKCRITQTTDSLLQEAIKDFDGKIEVKTYEANFSISSDPPLVRQLREKYKIVGLPEILVNGRKLGKFTKENLYNQICNNLILKPGVCK